MATVFEEQRDANAQLKAACFEYYSVQQALAKAEDEHLQLLSVSKQLAKRLEGIQTESQNLRKVRSAIADERDKEAQLPSGVPTVAFDAYVAHEKKLMAHVLAESEHLDALEKEVELLKRDLVHEGESTALLEEVLDSQVAFNNVLAATHRSGGARLASEHSKQATLTARLSTLGNELASKRSHTAQVRSSVRAQSAQRERTQTALRERDFDALRLRRDAAYARRLHLGEIEHARQQEAELQALVTENRRLKSLVDKRRAGRPNLRQDCESDSEASCDAPPRVGVEKVDRRTGKATFRALPVESNDEMENFNVHPPSKGKQQSRLLDQFRAHNVALLQQMVSTMQGLQLALEKPAA